MLGDLITAGNERSAGSGKKNAWNAKKSLDLIRFYDPGYETDEENAEQSSRKRIITLARHLGISSAQLNGFEVSYFYE